MANDIRSVERKTAKIPSLVELSEFRDAITAMEIA